MEKKIIVNGNEIEVNIISSSDGELKFLFNGKEYSFSLVKKSENLLSIKSGVNNLNVSYAVSRLGKNFACTDGSDVVIEIPKKGRSTKKNDEAGHMVSPMPGKIFKILLAEGTKVAKGDAILIMEAMKMEHTIRANIDGVISKIFYKEGDQIDGDVELVSISE